MAADGDATGSLVTVALDEAPLICEVESGKAASPGASVARHGRAASSDRVHTALVVHSSSRQSDVTDHGKRHSLVVARRGEGEGVQPAPREEPCDAEADCRPMSDYARLRALALEAKEVMLSEMKVVLLVYFISLARRRSRGFWPTLALVRNYLVFKVCYWMGLPQPSAAHNALATKRKLAAKVTSASQGNAAGSDSRNRQSFLFSHGFSLKAIRGLLRLAWNVKFSSASMFDVEFHVRVQRGAPRTTSPTQQTLRGVSPQVHQTARRTAATLLRLRRLSAIVTPSSLPSSLRQRRLTATPHAAPSPMAREHHRAGQTAARSIVEGATPNHAASTECTSLARGSTGSNTNRVARRRIRYAGQSPVEAVGGSVVSTRQRTCGWWTVPSHAQSIDACGITAASGALQVPSAVCDTVVEAQALRLTAASPVDTSDAPSALLSHGPVTVTSPFPLSLASPVSATRAATPSGDRSTPSLDGAASPSADTRDSAPLPSSGGAHYSAMSPTGAAKHSNASPMGDTRHSVASPSGGDQHSAARHSPESLSPDALLGTASLPGDTCHGTASPPSDGCHSEPRCTAAKPVHDAEQPCGEDCGTSASGRRHDRNITATIPRLSSPVHGGERCITPLPAAAGTEASRMTDSSRQCTLEVSADTSVWEGGACGEQELSVNVSAPSACVDSIGATAAASPLADITNSPRDASRLSDTSASTMWSPHIDSGACSGRSSDCDTVAGLICWQEDGEDDSDDSNGSDSTLLPLASRRSSGRRSSLALHASRRRSIARRSRRRTSFMLPSSPFVNGGADATDDE